MEMQGAAAFAEPAFFYGRPNLIFFLWYCRSSKDGVHFVFNKNIPPSAFCQDEFSEKQKRIDSKDWIFTEIRLFSFFFHNWS